MELLNRLYVTIQYHLGKANMVAGVLRREVINVGNLSFLKVSRWVG